MDWIIASAQLIAGLFLLLIAGDWLISSAVNLGTRWKLNACHVVLQLVYLYRLGAAQEGPQHEVGTT